MSGGRDPGMSPDVLGDCPAKDRICHLKALLEPVLDDELLTRGLGDEEARLLIDWLVDQAELFAKRLPASIDAGKK